MAAAVQSGVEKVLNKLSLGDSSDPPSVEQVQELRAKYAAVDQDHVFAFWDKLSNSEKASFFQQLSSINPEKVQKLSTDALSPPPPPPEPPVVEPLPESATASILDSPEASIKGWYEHGLDLMGKNEVAVVLMAGGQGTRLGSSAPKGCFDVGLPSKKSLFQLQAERIYKVQELASKKVGGKKVVVPWYIMTSGPTRGPTESFFKEHKFFGLEEKNVKFFEQGVLPCISNDGRIILESKSKVAVAPDGNGGIYRALASEVLPDMTSRGIKHVHAYCVDNSLVRVADPVFIGFSASKDVDLATKVVRKRSATESVGLIILKNGKPDVVEYSEIDQETAEAKDPKNKDILKFRAANIVNHYYTVRYLQTIPQWVDSLPHHVAKKKIPYCDTKTGQQQKPEKPNGIKLEQFVFDVFPQIPLNKFACMEVKREDEFSPLKNAKGTGEDDPDTSKRDVLNQGKRWVEAAGATLVSEEPETGVEISPLISYGGEGLEYLKGKEIRGPAAIEKE